MVDTRKFTVLSLALFTQGAFAVLQNPEAVVPPQCYTKTEGRHNPCYVCHQTHNQTQRRNGMWDGGLQAAYSFSSVGETNHWDNLFQQPAVADVSNDALTSYIRADNSSDLVAKSTDETYYQLDLNGLHLADGAFKSNGVAKDNSGWVAFNYKPFPSTFWPTNGSFDDTMIRLPERFRGSESHYFLNLAIVEMAVKDLSQISTLPIDENVIGIDLNQDGNLSVINHLAWQSHYFSNKKNETVKRFQYPVGTEFLHTVRYIDWDEQGLAKPSARLKEVRYSKKYKALSDAALRFAYNQEHREKALEQLPKYSWARPTGKAGLNNKFGWLIQGWIEDEQGALRSQTYEEHFYCMGCHTSVGTTIDSTFAFPRKVTGEAGWGYINLKGMKDVPNVGEQQGEYLTYLRRVGGGDEFRQNQEMRQRWFDQTGHVDTAKAAAADVYTLITPSKSRAMQLNQAYLKIVKSQRFLKGRDAVIPPSNNVYKKVDPATAPTLPIDKQYPYDLRLSW